MEKQDFLEFEEGQKTSGGFQVNIDAFEAEDDVQSESQPELLTETEATIDFNQFSALENKHEKKSKGLVGWWKNRKKWQKGLIITVISLLLVFSIVIGVVLSVFNYNYKKITANPEDLGFENIIDEKIVNVALFGIDTRSPDSFEGLSDSIMILSLNTETKEVKIISVMRDSFVPITYNGKTTYGKINSAYSKGGPELAIKTLNTIFNLDISEYATVNFYGMADIIDAVGGIEAELTSGEVKKSDGTQHSINGCIDEICGHLGLDSSKYHITTAGKHKLNGVQAVAYSRIRYVANIWGTNNDYGRTDRQRYVMEQLFNKALTMKKSQYVSLAKSLIPCCETSLSYTEIMGLAVDMLLESPTFSQTRVPQQEYQMTQPAGVGSVVYYDLDYVAKLIYAYIYEGITFDEYVEKNGITKNDWYGRGSSTAGSSSTPDSSTESATSSEISSGETTSTQSGTAGNTSSTESDVSSNNSSQPSQSSDEQTTEESENTTTSEETEASSNESGTAPETDAGSEEDGETNGESSQPEESDTNTNNGNTVTDGSANQTEGGETTEPSNPQENQSQENASNSQNTVSESVSSNTGA